METFIQQSESKAGELQRAQDQQSEALSAQSRAQEAIQFDAQVSQALLAKTSVAAANLQSVIDDAAFKFKHVSEDPPHGLSVPSCSSSSRPRTLRLQSLYFFSFWVRVFFMVETDWC